MTLAKRVFRAGSWSVAGFLLTRFIGFIRLTILARLLIPDDFGLFALVTVFIGGMVALSNVGIESVVIQKDHPDAAFLSAVWHLSWIRGVLLASICWVVAPYLAGFFVRPELFGLLRIAAFIPLVQGFTSMGVPLLERGLSFDRLMMMSLAHEVFQTVVTIVLAWCLGWGASALVYGLLAGHVLKVIVSYRLHNYRPNLYFSMDAVREIWAYGGHLLGAGILIYAMTNLDDAVIGRMLGAEKLGYYAVAFTLAGYLTSQIISLSNQVMFPAYAGVQADIERLVRVIRQHAHLTTAILTPLAIGAALLPDAVIQLAVGRQWLPAIPAFVVLLLMGWIRGCATVFGPVLLARGRTRALHKMKWIEFLVFAVSIVPSVYFFSIIGAAWVLTAVYTISLALHLWLVKTDLEIRLHPIFLELFSGALPGLVGGAAAYVFILIFNDSLAHWGWAASLVFVTVWGGVIWSKERDFLGDIWLMAKG